MKRLALPRPSPQELNVLNAILHASFVPAKTPVPSVSLDSCSKTENVPTLALKVELKSTDVASTVPIKIALLALLTSTSA